MKIGPRPLTTNTFRSGAGNAMNTVIFSGNAPSMWSRKMESQKMERIRRAKIKTALYSQQGKGDKEERDNLPK
jgi:hypothetical protein